MFVYTFTTITHVANYYYLLKLLTLNKYLYIRTYIINGNNLRVNFNQYTIEIIWKISNKSTVK